MVMENRAAVSASVCAGGMWSYLPFLFFETGAAGELRDSEYDELGRLDRCDADLDGEDARVAILRRVVLRVALHVERLGRRRAEQCTVAPHTAKEHRDGALHRVPQLRVVRFEHDPVGALQDRLFDVVEQAAHVEVAPFGITRQRPSAPDANALTRERSDAVHRDRVELIVLTFGDLQLERDHAADHFVRGRLVDTTGVIVAGPDAGDVAARWNERRLALQRVHHLDPRPVERGVLRVVPREVDAPFLDLLRIESWWRVEDRDTIGHQLAVRDHRQLYRFDAFAVDQPSAMRGHQVGHAEHGHFVDGFEAGEAGAVRGVADVVVGVDAGRQRRGRTTE